MISIRLASVPANFAAASFALVPTVTFWILI
jgi:hypothetical protein